MRASPHYQSIQGSVALFLQCLERGACTCPFGQRSLEPRDDLALPGDDVEISYPMIGQPPRVDSAKFTIVDFYESKMSEYDSNFVFVPLPKLQELRGMIDRSTGIARFTSIQIRVKDGVDIDMVRLAAGKLSATDLLD